MGSIFEGVRVVELAGGVPARYATMFLADHGADVIRVEGAADGPPTLDPALLTVDRAKRSVVVEAAGPTAADGGDPLADAGIAALVAGADVLVCDQPGQAAVLRAANPTAVIVTLPPWGERGPRVHEPATPDLVAAVSGILWNQQSYQDAPIHLVVPLVAYATGTLGALTIAAGLLARERHGAAPSYETSWVAGAAALQLEQFAIDGVVEERAGSAPMGSKGRVPVYRLFEAGDGRWFFLACGTPRFYDRLLDVVGRSDLKGDPRLPSPPWGLMDIEALGFIAPILEDAFATKGRDEWLALLADADVPAQPVQTRDEFLTSSVAEANAVVVTVDHPLAGPVRMMGVPLVLEAAPGRVRRGAPLVGEHTAEVLAEPPRPPRAGADRTAAAADGDRPPLEGIEVLDLSSFIAGPVVSRHLAMLGADVIKVEPPTGDPFRAFGAPFACWNHGKRSIALDLHSPEGRAVLLRLVARADAVVENARPGVAARLGSDYETLAAVNPDLVYLSSSGYGDDMSMAAAPAFDPLMQCLGGIMAAQGGMAATGDGAEPVFLTVAIHDVVTPIISAFGIVAALYHRERTGVGQRVRTSLARTTTAVQAAEYVDYAGRPPVQLGGWDFPGPGPGHGCVEEDGTWVFLEGPHRVPIELKGVLGAAVVVENDLLVTHDHPEWGRITSPGQLVVGAGPPPGRGPVLDEHRDEILAELEP